MNRYEQNISKTNDIYFAYLQKNKKINKWRQKKLDICWREKIENIRNNLFYSINKWYDFDLI
jgi:hypothetical protein